MLNAMAPGWRQPHKGGFGHWPSPLPEESVRLVMSPWVGPAAIEVLGPSEDVWLQLPPPGSVITFARRWATGDKATALVVRSWQLLGPADVSRQPVSLPRSGGRSVAGYQAGESMRRPAA